MDRSWAVSFLGQFETNNIFSQADFDPVGKRVQVERAVPCLIPSKPNEALPSLPHQFFQHDDPLTLNAQGHRHNFIDKM
jgi:hypothetical protein